MLYYNSYPHNGITVPPMLETNMRGKTLIVTRNGRTIYPVGFHGDHVASFTPMVQFLLDYRRPCAGSAIVWQIFVCRQTWMFVIHTEKINGHVARP